MITNVLPPFYGAQCIYANLFVYKCFRIYIGLHRTSTNVGFCWKICSNSENCWSFYRLDALIQRSLCIRHLCVVRCSRTSSWHLRRQTPLSRPSLAMTSSRPCINLWASSLHVGYCIPATSAPLERIFSHMEASSCNLTEHACMSDSVLSDLVFAKCNARL